ncbi:MAG: PqiC family protein [Pseudomonadota bacterium]
MIRRPLVLGLVALAACSNDANIERYPIPLLSTENRIEIAADTVEVRLVSLPLYAESEEVPLLGGDGALRTSADVLWADEPDRALSQALARNLTEITSAVVAVEPWPLEGFPETRIEVRVDALIAPPGGILRFAGAWYAASPGTPGQDRSARFQFSQPLAGDGVPALAEAYAEVTLDLARTIAEGLR